MTKKVFLFFVLALTALFLSFLVVSQEQTPASPSVTPAVQKIIDKIQTSKGNVEDVMSYIAQDSQEAIKNVYGVDLDLSSIVGVDLKDGKVSLANNVLTTTFGEKSAISLNWEDYKGGKIKVEKNGEIIFVPSSEEEFSVSNKDKILVNTESKASFLKLEDGNVVEINGKMKFDQGKASVPKSESIDILSAGKFQKIKIDNTVSGATDLGVNFNLNGDPIGEIPKNSINFYDNLIIPNIEKGNKVSLTPDWIKEDGKPETFVLGSDKEITIMEFSLPGSGLTRDLKYGMTGPEVKERQAKVKAWLKDVDPVFYEKFKVDGIFGPDTKKAFEMYQEYLIEKGQLTNVRPEKKDGIWGERTERASLVKIVQGEVELKEAGVVFKEGKMSVGVKPEDVAVKPSTQEQTKPKTQPGKIVAEPSVKKTKTPAPQIPQVADKDALLLNGVYYARPANPTGYDGREKKYYGHFDEAVALDRERYEKFVPFAPLFAAAAAHESGFKTGKDSISTFGGTEYSVGYHQLPGKGAAYSSYDNKYYDGKNYDPLNGVENIKVAMNFVEKELSERNLPLTAQNVIDALRYNNWQTKEGGAFGDNSQKIWDHALDFYPGGEYYSEDGSGSLVHRRDYYEEKAGDVYLAGATELAAGMQLYFKTVPQVEGDNLDASIVLAQVETKGGPREMTVTTQTNVEGRIPTTEKNYAFTNPSKTALPKVATKPQGEKWTFSEGSKNGQVYTTIDGLGTFYAKSKVYKSADGSPTIQDIYNQDLDFDTLRQLEISSFSDFNQVKGMKISDYLTLLASGKKPISPSNTRVTSTTRQAPVVTPSTIPQNGVVAPALFQYAYDNRKSWIQGAGDAVGYGLPHIRKDKTGSEKFHASFDVPGFGDVRFPDFSGAVGNSVYGVVDHIGDNSYMDRAQGNIGILFYSNGKPLIDADTGEHLGLLTIHHSSISARVGQKLNPGDVYAKVGQGHVDYTIGSKKLWAYDLKYRGPTKALTLQRFTEYKRTKR